ncbi:probable serine/threonine-protein kinase NAK, partial [Tanacetum coccineum]
MHMIRCCFVVENHLNNEKDLLTFCIYGKTEKIILSILVLNMKILEEINDPNVVKILGYCMEEDLVPIIYEFMHQGTLKEYLFSIERMTERHRLFSRVKIATGVVRGLIFLRTQPQLADCSLKIHNILLDEGNVGLIFTKGDLKEVNEEVAKYK